MWTSALSAMECRSAGPNNYGRSNPATAVSPLISHHPFSGNARGNFRLGMACRHCVMSRQSGGTLIFAQTLCRYWQFSQKYCPFFAKLSSNSTTVATLAIVVRGHDCFLFKIFPGLLGDLIMKLKAIALAVSLSVFGATAFAADLDSTLLDAAVIAGDGSALTAVQDLAYTTDMLSGGVVGDTALIVQELSTGNVAMIDQAATDGSQFAAIVQSNTGIDAAAYIAQSGSDNRALINQHD